ncbi:anthocyanidin reductase-like isoform X1 [Hibiscus syriacus]|uniref:Anthocyanidin reductase-like isoform X1 n=1 Tax=Hibiscus syriacus TaxID=106335 RepID=A0A6A2WY41_HIBSY|nr:anthocyanidin reductase-like isoform X1 [Hibiscus syriacus]
MEKANCRVCVTGATGDVSKVELLKSLPHADTKLVLFEADIYKPNEFEQAIHGCSFVFHVATPLQHSDDSQFKNTTEAAVSATKSIAECCIKSGTVKRLIYTASVCAASPLKEDGNGYKDTMDETCWTPLDLSLAYSYEFFKASSEYTVSKTLAEKELLNSEKYGELEVLTNNTFTDQFMKYTEELLGKLPIVHINDVCEAHIFCMENPSISGRFLIASSFISAAELAGCFQLHYPEFNVKAEKFDGPRRDIKWDSTKLIEKGFEYKCDLKMKIDDSIKCARRTGELQQ